MEDSPWTEGESTSLFKVDTPRLLRHQMFLRHCLLTSAGLQELRVEARRVVLGTMEPEFGGTDRHPPSVHVLREEGLTRQGWRRGPPDHPLE